MNLDRAIMVLDRINNNVDESTRVQTEMLFTLKSFKTGFERMTIAIQSLNIVGVRQMELLKEQMLDASIQRQQVDDRPPPPSKDKREAATLQRGFFGDLIESTQRIVLGLLALGISAKAIYEPTNKLVQEVDQWLQGTLAFIGFVGEIFIKMTSGIGKAFAFFGRAIKSIPIIGKILGFAGMLVREFLSFFRILASPFSQFAGIFKLFARFSGALSIVLVAFDGIVSAIKTAREGGNAIEITLSFFKGAIMSIWDTLVGFVKVFKLVGNFVYDLIKSASLRIGEAFGVKDQVAGFFKTLEDSISFVMRIFQDVFDWVSGVWDWIKDFTGIDELISDIRANGMSSIRQMGRDFMNNGKILVERVVGFFTDIWSGISNFFTENFGSLKQSFFTIFNHSPIGVVINTIAPVLEDVFGFAADKLSEFVSFFTGIKDSITGFFEKVKARIDEEINKLKNLIDSVIPDIGDVRPDTFRDRGFGPGGLNFDFSRPEREMQSRSQDLFDMVAENIKAAQTSVTRPSFTMVAPSSVDNSSMVLAPTTNVHKVPPMIMNPHDPRY